MHMDVCDFLFLIHQHTFYPRVVRSFYTGILVCWFYLLPHTSLRGKQVARGSKQHVCSCKSSAELRAAGVCPAGTLQSSRGDTHHQSRAPETLVCQSIHARLIDSAEETIRFVWSVNPGTA